MLPEPDVRPADAEGDLDAVAVAADAPGVDEVAEVVHEGAVASEADVPAELAPDDPRAALPPDLRSESTSIRLGGLAMRESHADATWVYDTVLRHDPHPGVREKAWQVVAQRWRSGVGDPAQHEAIALWVLDNGTFETQLGALGAITRDGSDVALLLPKLDDHRNGVRRAASEAIALMATRTGQQDVARQALQARLDVETDERTRGRIEKALGRL